MKIRFAIYTANHGLEWQGVPACMSLLELDSCRSIFGPLPDFDAGDIGFEGVAVKYGRVFVARCFKAQKWDFMGRDSLYLVVAWMSPKDFNNIDVNELLSLRWFKEPMRNPPFEFDFSKGNIKNQFADNLEEGMIWRREIGEADFVVVSKSNKELGTKNNKFNVESLRNNEEVPSTKENSSSPKRKVDLVWVLIVLLLVLVLALFIYDVFKNSGEVRNDRNGKVLTGDKLHVENSETNRVSSGAVSSGEFKK
jgi:hypothetical protein